MNIFRFLGVVAVFATLLVFGCRNNGAPNLLMEASPALAHGTYNLVYTWPIKRTSAPNWPGFDGAIMETLYLGKWTPPSGYTAPSDGTISSDWSYIRCSKKGDVYKAWFTARAAAWPTTWPTKATCSYTDGSGNHVIVAEITLTNDYDATRAGGSWDEPVGWDPDDGIDFDLGQGSFVIAGTSVTVTEDHAHAVRHLPSGDYADGGACHAAKKGALGTTWDGVECCVDDVNDLARVIVHPNAPEFSGDTGKCVFTRTGDTNVVVKPIRLDRP